MRTFRAVLMESVLGPNWRVVGLFPSDCDLIVSESMPMSLEKAQLLCDQINKGAEVVKREAEAKETPNADV